MYLKVKANIDDIIFIYKGTDKDLIALQLQAIKDTGLADRFENEFSSLTLCEKDIDKFVLGTIPAWLTINGFYKTRELIVKRVRKDICQTLEDLLTT